MLLKNKIRFSFFLGKKMGFVCAKIKFLKSFFCLTICFTVFYTYFKELNCGFKIDKKGVKND